MMSSHNEVTQYGSHHVLSIIRLNNYSEIIPLHNKTSYIPNHRWSTGYVFNVCPCVKLFP